MLSTEGLADVVPFNPKDFALFIGTAGTCVLILFDDTFDLDLELTEFFIVVC